MCTIDIRAGNRCMSALYIRIDMLLLSIIGGRSTERLFFSMRARIKYYLIHSIRA